ncbi:hypothetical protein VK792_03320 [Mesobacterium sp. TK19101]|uniref:DUF3329 domain-containing protein n=1 Tax=Mesobacterium hydrothermale TaxID=3111907 RepID=A0ABU6HFP9_9RHOB|nr:hypothetical protein [Mesobacterium sp. TK19101]MEC3860303.1 hypothetical protein [Mesobacterium sp. TK19101]
MPLLDTKHPFFRPAWRRYALVAVSFIWAGVELSYGSQIWAYLCAAIGGFLAWKLIVTWTDPDGS